MIHGVLAPGSPTVRCGIRVAVLRIDVEDLGCLVEHQLLDSVRVEERRRNRALADRTPGRCDFYSNSCSIAKLIGDVFLVRPVKPFAPRLAFTKFNSFSSLRRWGRSLGKFLNLSRIDFPKLHSTSFQVIGELAANILDRHSGEKDR